MCYGTIERKPGNLDRLAAGNRLLPGHGHAQLRAFLSGRGGIPDPDEGRRRLDVGAERAPAGLCGSFRGRVQLSAVSPALSRRRVLPPPGGPHPHPVRGLEHRVRPDLGRTGAEFQGPAAQLQLRGGPSVVRVHARGPVPRHAAAVSLGGESREARTPGLSGHLALHDADPPHPPMGGRRRTGHLRPVGHSERRQVSPLGRGQLEYLRRVLLSERFHRLPAAGPVFPQVRG